MRITFVSPTPNMTGGVRVVAIYAELLARRGHQVTVVYPAPEEEPLRRRIKSLLTEGRWPAAPVVPPSHLDGRAFDKKETPRGRPVRDEDLPDADVVIATWWETAEWVAALAPSKGKKVYFVQHHELFDGLPHDRVRATYRLPLHKITIARWLVDVMRDEYGDNAVANVPNSVDLEQFQAPVRGKQPTPTVGLVYSGASFKGTDIALHAVELARAKIPNLQVVAFGAKDPTEPLLRGPGVTFVRDPPQESLRSLYASADAWIMASRSEGFGLPLLEAMACGTPILGTPTGAAPELVEKGGGLLVPHENPPALAAAIEEIARMSDVDWRALSARARVIASSYTWDDATSLFEKALLDVAQK